MKKQIKSILCVFAHPDDEYFSAGTLLRAKKLGIKTHLICCTKGEGGRIFGEYNVSKREKIKVRTGELNKTAEFLNVNSLQILDYRDGSSEEWDEKKLMEEIVSNIEIIKPDIIITFGIDGGINGHKDHKRINEIVCNVYKKYSFEDKIKLYFPSFIPETVYSKYYKNLSLKSELVEKIIVNDDEVSSILELSEEEHEKKVQIIDYYKSQFPDLNGLYYYMKKEYIQLLSKFECFIQYKKVNKKNESYEIVDMLG